MTRKRTVPAGTQVPRKIRPGIKLVPALRDGDPVFRREGVHPLLGEQFVEHRAMHVVDVVIRIEGTEHLLQRPPPVLVGGLGNKASVIDCKTSVSGAESPSRGLAGAL